MTDGNCYHVCYISIESLLDLVQQTVTNLTCMAGAMKVWECDEQVSAAMYW